jgi:glycosyl transferase family 41
MRSRATSSSALLARRFESPLLPLQRPHENDADPERRLRIGDVSPDFRSNVVAHYVEPILRNHDRARFEVVCYSTGAIRDDLTAMVSSVVDRWHDVHALPDDEIAQLIRSLGIDVLVDLCGHGSGNRILVFARKPAPVQTNYLEYSAATGMTSIDYRLTTEACDPTGRAEPAPQPAAEGGALSHAGFPRLHAGSRSRLPHAVESVVRAIYDALNLGPEVGRQAIERLHVPRAP